MPEHNRKLVIGGVALVQERLRNITQAMQSVADEIEPVMLQSEFLASAPFEWVGLMIRFGLQDKLEPEYQRINKKYGDLPIAVEVDTHRLLKVDVEQIKNVIREATIEALLHVAKKYNLPAAELEEYKRSLAAPGKDNNELNAG